MIASDGPRPSPPGPLLRALVAALRAELERAWQGHATRVMLGGADELMALKKSLDGVTATAAAGPLAFIHDVQERRRAAHPDRPAADRLADEEDDDSIEVARRDARRRMRR